MDNKYMTLREALNEAQTRLKDGQPLSDGATNWDIYNLIEGVDPATDEPREDGYYVVGWDGSIGDTTDDGYNVRWIYRAI